MAETIVQCDCCGAHGRRAENAAAPDFWFYIESVDRTFGKDGIYVVWACSEACRDGMWKRGPGRATIDDAGTFKRRAKRAAVAGSATADREAIETELCIVRASCEAAHVEVERLRALINTPRIDEFFEAVRIEAAHQVERWGVDHDAGKRAEDWITLYMYLLGKAATAHFAGDREKLLHHIITVAAVALNWHRNMTGESTLMRPGVGPIVAGVTP